MTAERLDSIETEHAALRRELNELDKMVTRILAKIDIHFSDEKKFEKTIENIDDNLKALMLDMAKQPMIRNREVQAIVEPIWESVRSTKKEISDYKTLAEKEHQDIKHQVKNEIRSEAKSHIIVAWTLVVAIVVIAGYSIKRIDERIQENGKSLERHHENHFYLDADREHNGKIE